MKLKLLCRVAGSALAATALALTAPSPAYAVGTPETDAQVVTSCTSVSPTTDVCVQAEVTVEALPAFVNGRYLFQYNCAATSYVRTTDPAAAGAGIFTSVTCGLDSDRGSWLSAGNNGPQTTPLFAIGGAIGQKDRLCFSAAALYGPSNARAALPEACTNTVTFAVVT